jgi:hypothetical protein
MGELGQKKCSNYLSSHLMLYHRLVGRGGKNPYRTARLIYILAVHISSSLDNSLLLTARYMVVWSRRAGRERWNHRSKLPASWQAHILCIIKYSA